MPRAKTYEVEATETATVTRDDAEDFITADRSKDAKDRAAKEKDSKREKQTEERQFFEQVQRDVGKIIRKEECSEFLKQNEVNSRPHCLSDYGEDGFVGPSMKD